MRREATVKLSAECKALPPNRRLAPAGGLPPPPQPYRSPIESGVEAARIAERQDVSASVQQRQRERLKIGPTIRSVSLGARPCRSKRPVYGDGTRNPFQTQTAIAAAPRKQPYTTSGGYKGRAISIRLPFITRCSRFRRVSDRRVNAKRGLNRLFVALTVLWAAYCLVGYPFQKRFEAVNKWNADLKMCSEQTQGEMKECYDLVQQNYLTAVAPWQLPYFYSWAWPFLLAAALGVPLVVYPALLCARRCLSLGRARV